MIKVDENYRKKYWTPRGNELKEDSDPEQWLLPAVGVHIPTEHTARQLLNVARAGVLAKADGINWLLHIDSDEAFWVQELRSGIAKTFFSQLDKQKITHVSIMNDEVAPKTPDFKSKKLPKDPFHQRLFFKRNDLAMDGKQRSHAQELSAASGLKLFLGYMCGKSAINVALWRKNNGESAPILPQHVVNFAYSSSQPGNVSVINENTMLLQPYISSEILKIALVRNVARILHFVNPDFESMQKKFSARKKFNADIFDTNLIGKSEKRLYDKWKRNWIKAEKMPNWQFYNEMWSRVQRDLKTGGKEAFNFYIKAAVTPKDTKKMKKYLESGLIYKNKEIMQFIVQISRLMEAKTKTDKSQILLEIANGVRFVNGGNAQESKITTYELYQCKEKGPHFFCDVDDCCAFAANPHFTFSKRMVGYKRYEAFQWWRPGLKWPM